MSFKYTAGEYNPNEYLVAKGKHTLKFTELERRTSFAKGTEFVRLKVEVVLGIDSGKTFYEYLFGIWDSVGNMVEKHNRLNGILAAIGLGGIDNLDDILNRSFEAEVIIQERQNNMGETKQYNGIDFYYPEEKSKSIEQKAAECSETKQTAATKDEEDDVPF